MKSLAKNRLNKGIERVFRYIKNKKIYKKSKKLNFRVRILLFTFFFVWFVIGTLLIPPIPFGNAALILGLIILFPIGRVKYRLKWLINKLRINKIYAKRLQFKHKNKQS